MPVILVQMHQANPHLKCLRLSTNSSLLGVVVEVAQSIHQTRHPLFSQHKRQWKVRRIHHTLVLIIKRHFLQFCQLPLPHKGSNLASLVSNTASATSSVFNNNFMPDFNSSSFYSSVSNLEPTTSESTNTSTTTNYTPRRSERKKTTSTLTSSSSKAIGTRKATSKKSANAQSSNASVDLKYSNLESSSSANLFNSKRHFNDNYFLIPDIISPSTTASGNNTNNTNSFAISVSGSHHPVPVVSNFSSVDHSSSSHFSNRYNFFTSTSEQPSLVIIDITRSIHSLQRAIQHEIPKLSIVVKTITTVKVS